MNGRLVSQKDEVAEKDLEKVIQHWRKVRPLLSKIRDEDKPEYRQLRGEMEPLLVKLQVVYSR